MNRKALSKNSISSLLCASRERIFSMNKAKAWFKRRILHAPYQILILVDSNEYVRLI